VLQDKDQLIETTYIDDFTRASRDEVEWWRLAYLSRRLQTRMIGAGDGFDLSSPNWDMMISVYGLLSRLFIKGLREKVIRGMRGAARRGGSLGKQSLGFTRRARRDEHGNVVRDKEGNPEYVPCIDPQTCGDREKLFELFLEKSWSRYQITRDFNARKVDGWDGWTEAASLR
jgi:DNA invertase Pin-like site-specific DNA recombinase